MQGVGCVLDMNAGLVALDGGPHMVGSLVGTIVAVVAFPLGHVGGERCSGWWLELVLCYW